jgi:hypothetical protein
MTSGGMIREHIILSNDLPDGVYLLSVRTAKGNNVFHIVLKK